MLKNRMFQFLLLSVLLLLATACGAGSETTSDGSNDDSEGVNKETVLVLAHGYTETDFRAIGYEKWAELVNERSGGSIKIKIHPGGTLVTFPEGYDAVATGTVDMFANISLYMSPQISELKVLDPVAIYDITQWIELNEAVTPLLDEILKEHNMKFLHMDYQGSTTVVSTTPEPLIHPSDWKGIRFRDAGPDLGKVISHLGGSSTTIPLEELPTAISNGVVDAVLQGFSFIKSMGYYEFMDSIALLPNTSNSFGLLTINLDTWNGLSSEQQQILIETGNEILPVYEDLGKDAYNEIIELMDDEGANYYILTSEEETEMNDAFQTFFEDIYESANDKGKELYDIVQQYR